MYRKQKNPKDVMYILENLRKEDIEECKIVHGADWKQKSFDAVMQTDFEVLVGVTKNGDIPVCMGGVWHLEKDDSKIATAWLLSTDEVQNHKISLLKELKKEFEKYDKKYDLTYNLIYEKNYMAKNWLKWLGFRFDNPKPEGFNVPEGFEFFYRLKNN